MMKVKVKIGNKWVGDDCPCFIVAEIGINHNGSLEIAKKLIDAAVEAGADVVKFQKREVRLVYSREQLAEKRKVDESIIRSALDPARNVIEGIEWPVLPEESVVRLKANISDTINGDLKNALELSEKMYDMIDIYCQEKGIMWFVSSWDGISSHNVGGYRSVPCDKVASACLTDKDLLLRIRSNERPIILSTGGSTMEQIEKAVEILGREDLIILHCVASYPCKDEEINLLVMNTLRKKFPNVPIGYSGHETGILPSVAAAVMGACMVERHITLNKKMPGSDHKASLEPQEFKEMVDQIRRFEKIRGDGVKRVWESEIPVMEKLRRKTDF